ncbi:glycosyltransferase, partial [Pseudoalteromonas sp. CAL494-MNA-CIBAN-0108]
GVNLAFYYNSQQKLSEEYVEQFIPKNKFIVTYTGTFGEANALEYIIEAAKKLKHTSKIHFLLVGEGYLKEELKDNASELTNITFAPKV